MARKIFYFKGLAWLIALALLLEACNRGNLTPSPVAPDATPARSSSEGSTPERPTFTLTPFQPSPTPVALAARVNDTEITLAEYQAELARYKAAAGTNLAPEDEKRVLDDLIDQALLAQGAAEKGFTVDDATLQKHLDQLTEQLGGAKALSDWMAAQGYVEATFRHDLALSIAAAWMRDQIAASVPQEVEQVNARQILVFSEDQANEVLSQLQSGKDFATLAATYDPVREGDLGWFPRGYLPDPELEKAAFSLEPGKYSGVIKTSTGYHIIQVIERDPKRLLDPDARLVLQTQALQNWLQEQRSQSNIQVLLPLKTTQ